MIANPVVDNRWNSGGMPCESIPGFINSLKHAQPEMASVSECQRPMDRLIEFEIKVKALGKRRLFAFLDSREPVPSGVTLSRNDGGLGQISKSAFILRIFFDAIFDAEMS